MALLLYKNTNIEVFLTCISINTSVFPLIRKQIIGMKKIQKYIKKNILFTVKMKCFDFNMFLFYFFFFFYKANLIFMVMHINIYNNNIGLQASRS